MLKERILASRGDIIDNLDAKIWIVRKQFRRKNLDVIVKVQLNTNIDELQREEARERSLQNLQQVKPKESTDCQLIDSREKLTQKEKAEARV